MRAATFDAGVTAGDPVSGALVRHALGAALVLVLGACGGGGDSGAPVSTYQPTSPDAWKAGVFKASSSFAAQCKTPRTGTDPNTGNAYADTQGTATTENNYLRSWTNELYLWYSEVPDVNPANYSSTADYFDLLKTSATTSTGSPKDRFHFTYPTSEWEALSQSGVDVGYGANWDLTATTPPRQAYVAYVEGGSVAANAGVMRGDQILKIDGIDLVQDNTQAGIDTLNQGLSPTASGESHTFVLQAQNGTTRTVTLTAGSVTETPVPIVHTISTSNGLVGYMLFNDHIATAEQQLITGIQQLKTAGVTDLVLDMRYNGGGYLDIASELAFMIAGPTATSGKAFEQITFNAKYPTTNPVTHAALTPTPFWDTAQGFSSSPAAGTSLPYLGLSRVFILTGSGTCSASEALINGLTGVNVQVIQIGSTTCGKPYGFYPDDNCGTTYFSIEFQTDNDKGLGGYSDGFSPQNSTSPTSAVLPGCSLADDFAHPLGDPAEGRLAAALSYRGNPVCSAPTGVQPPPGLGLSRLQIHRSLLRENSFRTR